VIAVLAHTHPSITSGGAEISAYTLYRGLKALGQPAVFIAMCPEDAIHKADAKSDDEYLVPFHHRGYDDFHHRAEPGVVAQIDNLLNELGCETVIFHHFLFFGANTIRRVAENPQRQVLLVLHEFLAICHHHGQMVTRPALRLCNASSAVACAKCFPDLGPDQFLVRKASFLDCLQNVVHFVSPSQFLKDRFVAWGLRADQMAVIENGVPHLPPPEPQRTAGPAADEASTEAPLVVGFFGQINPFKGVDLLLDAVELMDRDPALAKRVRLRVHGPLVGVSPEFTARFEKLAEKSPCLDFRGPYQNDKVFDLMRECDFVLMASKWWENSPVVIQESYACGRPMIVPGLGGMAEKIIDGQTGLHFQMGDARDLVRVLALASTPGMAARLRLNLPTVATAEDMATNYLALLQGLQTPHAAAVVQAATLESCSITG